MEHLRPFEYSLIAVVLESSISELISIGFLENNDLLYSKPYSSNIYYLAKLAIYGYAVSGFAIQSLQFPNLLFEQNPLLFSSYKQKTLTLSSKKPKLFFHNNITTLLFTFHFFSVIYPSSLNIDVLLLLQIHLLQMLIS